MKKLLFITAISLCAAAGSVSAQTNDWAKYGQEFKMENVQTMRSITKLMSDKKEANDISLEGYISQVCQAEGCWIKLKNDEGEDVMVKFKDHAFFVPKDIAGKAAIVKGRAIKRSVSVDERRHLAKDAGASDAEIAQITTPKEELRIEATGVMVK
jgi:hypothetical protein